MSWTTHPTNISNTFGTLGLKSVSRCPQWPHVQIKSFQTCRPRCLPSLPVSLLKSFSLFSQTPPSLFRLQVPAEMRWLCRNQRQTTSRDQTFVSLLMEKTFCRLALRSRPCDAAPSPRRLLTNQTPVWAAARPADAVARCVDSFVPVNVGQLTAQTWWLRSAPYAK